MSTTAKVLIVLAVLGGGCLLLCCGGVFYFGNKVQEFVKNATSDDPETIRCAVNAARALDPAAAIARARELTWERSARATLALYEELVPTAGASPSRATPAAARASASG